jgi:ABC-type phosphate transport system substrate-binding protein
MKRKIELKKEKFSKANFNIFFVLVLLAISVYLNSCGNADEKNKWEAVNSGKITVYCDESVYKLLQKPFRYYDSAYKDIKLTVIKVSARDAMAKLLSGGSPAVIIARDYLHDEDSLMKAFKVHPHERMIYAEDALVFFANKEYPLDSMNDGQVKKLFTDKNTDFKKLFPKIKKEPKLAINSVTSSEYANLKHLVIKDSKLNRKLIYLSNSDSVVQYVKENPDAIGIGFLSQVVNDLSLKLIKIGFVDTTGKYIFPHVVHQANIVRRYYPYIVPEYVYLLEDRKNLPFWFAIFIAKERVVQTYFKDAGIVPAFARFKLIGEEEE